MSAPLAPPFDLLPRAIAVVAPHVDAIPWAEALNAPMRAAGITTARRIAMFLGQCAEESGGFLRLEESLYYTTAAHLCEVWPSRFQTIADAVPYIGEPETLANCVYAARMGNGDVHSCDGWRFRGRGLIQITGRRTYEEFAHTQDKDADEIADWLTTPDGAAASACWYWGWAYHGALNAKADAWDVLGATRMINGGETDLARRVLLCGAALAVFIPVTPPESEADKLNDAELARIRAFGATEGSKSGG